MSSNIAGSNPEWQRKFNERRVFHESRRRARGVSHMPDAEYATLLAETASAPMSASSFEQLLASVREAASQITETAPDPAPAAPPAPEMTAVELARMPREQLTELAGPMLDAMFAGHDARAARSSFWQGLPPLGGDAA